MFVNHYFLCLEYQNSFKNNISVKNHINFNHTSTCKRKPLQCQQWSTSLFWLYYLFRYNKLLTIQNCPQNRHESLSSIGGSGSSCIVSRTRNSNSSY